jgi:proline iminopeptidase
MLPVTGGHVVHWEEIGPENGVPVLVLHGGPGGHIKPYYRRLLDPAQHRGVFFDQRGCGQSTPFGSLDNNTTADLVADIEALREARGIARWIVVGGSWGSTLALAYAQTHQDRLLGLLVSGVFLADAADQHWWWEGGRAVFPEVFAARDSLLTKAERSDPRTAFLARILDPDPAIHGPAAMVLGHSEAQTLDLYAPPPPDDVAAIDPKDIAATRIFAHFDRADYFLARGQLLANAPRLAAVPGEIVAGRSDMCTPPRAAWELASAWPGARLTIVPAAGHRWNDEALGGAVISALQRLSSAITYASAPCPKG